MPPIILDTAVKPPLRILVAEGDSAIRYACQIAIDGLGHIACAAANAVTAFRAIDADNISIVLLDSNVSGHSGEWALVRDIRSRYPSVVVVVMAAVTSAKSLMSAIQAGGFDYLEKPFSIHELRLAIRRAAAHFYTSSERRVQRSSPRLRDSFAGMIGRSPDMNTLYRLVERAANSTHPVLVTGESGTGKELVARAIHQTGPCKGKRFVPIDCGTLVPTLIESELFGHVKGAFTGANLSRDGLLASARGGTVFLDEVGELPTQLQAKLLRAIQEKEVRPVGSVHPIALDLRIVAATNRDLESAVESGAFRRDLYFRLNVLSLRVPPLRERKQDIPGLIGHFLERISRQQGAKRYLTVEAVSALVSYGWPGNVRELENYLERVCTLHDETTLDLMHLPEQLLDEKSRYSRGKRGSLAEVEKRTIIETLELTRGDKLKAAAILGLGKTTLYRKLKEYGPQVHAGIG